jgi:NAD(P)-dependent dehydrogenase (short-subunit alcohol dehydrogenase family)
MVVVIAGASQGLGLALCQSYLSINESNVVFGTYRSKITDSMKELTQTYPERLVWLQHDIDDEASYENLKNKIVSDGHSSIHRFINCIGALQIEGLIAERKVEEVSLENMKKSFLVNSIPTMLFAKYLKELFKHKEYAVFAAISAKVASLEDNSLGGWYSYRASKTALNMFIKNLSLEFKRLGPEKYVITIHPGTTQTRLSEPFMAVAAKKYTIHSPLESAENLMKVFENLKPENQGQFLNYDHSVLPW